MKTISDNEIVETSRGRKRIGALFDENAMLISINSDLLSALEDMLRRFDYDRPEGPLPCIIEARAAIAKAKGE